ncbi:MAG: hypothetical protein LBJ62_07335 [Bifidobacteriaceae bacterium]|nr:hypothetical protein [Bifidobacteriaceae bacterium]
MAESSGFGLGLDDAVRPAWDWTMPSVRLGAAQRTLRKTATRAHQIGYTSHAKRQRTLR